MTRFPTVKHGRLTPDEDAEIERLAERRLTCGQIALRLNRHPATVNFAMHRLAVKTVDRRRAGKSYIRNGREVRHFTLEEDALMVDLRTEGLAFPRIAGLLSERFGGHPRTAQTISVRLMMLANLEEAA